MLPDFSPIFAIALIGLGLAAGIVLTLLLWIFIPAGAWMMIPPIGLGITAAIISSNL